MIYFKFTSISVNKNEKKSFNIDLKDFWESNPNTNNWESKFREISDFNITNFIKNSLNIKMPQKILFNYKVK